MSTATAALSVNIIDNAQRATSNINAFTAAAQKAQKVVSDFTNGLAIGAKQAWEEHARLTQRAVAPTQQFTQQVQKSNDVVSKFADTLTRRFVTGLIITQLRSVATQLVAINSEIARTGDLSNRTRIGSGDLQGLIGAAGNEGIKPSEFLDSFAKLNQQIDLAKQGSGDLLTFFRANNLAIGDTKDAFLKIPTLIQNARDEQTKINILSAAGLPTSEAFARLMEQGADAIQRAADNVPKLTKAQLDAARELEKEFNKTWTNIEQYGKSAFVGIGSVFASTIKQDIEDVKRVVAFFQSLPDFASKYNAGLTGQPLRVTVPVGDKIPPAAPAFPALTGTTKNPLYDEAAVARLSQLVSLLGNLATVDQQVTLKTGELNIAALKNADITKDRIAAIVAETKLQGEATLASARLQIGLASEADIRQQVLASLPPSIRAMAEQTEAVRKQTEQLSIQNQVSASTLAGLKQLELTSASVRTQMDQLGVGVVNGITNPLVDLASGATKAGDAFKQMGLNIIRSIEQMIVNMTIAVPIARTLQSVLGGFVPGAGIGWAGQPTALGSAAMVTSANGNVFSGRGISAFSSQIVDRPTIFPFAKGAGLMGEDGAEAIMPLTRIGGKLGVRAEGGSSSTTVNVSFGDIHVPQDPNGNDPTGVTRGATIAKALESSMRNIVKDEIIKSQKPRGLANRASSI